jgi:two-component system CheB/CheR fusion protein
MPPQSGMAFVLIQHLEPKHDSALTTLLSRATSMPVLEASDQLEVEPNHVYIIPPNRNMTILKGTLRLAPRSEVSSLQRPIDEFSVSLAEEQGYAA